MSRGDDGDGRAPLRSARHSYDPLAELDPAVAIVLVLRLGFAIVAAICAVLTVVDFATGFPQLTFTLLARIAMLAALGAVAFALPRHATLPLASRGALVFCVGLLGAVLLQDVHTGNVFATSHTAAGLAVGAAIALAWSMRYQAALIAAGAAAMTVQAVLLDLGGAVAVPMVVLLASAPTAWIVRRNREALAAAQATAERAARDAVELKDRFLAHISHEIRTPLSAIIGYAELLGEDDGSPEERREMQRRLLGNAEHLLVIVNDLLDLSRLEAGHVELQAQPFSPRALLDEVVAQSEVLAARKGLALESGFDPALPPMLVGDPERLRQILLNLVSNAIKFTPAGTVRLAAARRGDAQWTLAVRDTGIGIPRAEQERVFTSFHQVPGTATGQGTGLGLAICCELADLMRGTISVESEIGRGSTFTVTLPLLAAGDAD